MLINNELNEEYKKFVDGFFCKLDYSDFYKDFCFFVFLAMENVFKDIILKGVNKDE